MKNRYASIDALRGVAAFGVFAYHFWNVFAPGYSPQGSPADHKPFTSETPLGVILTYPFCAYGYLGVGLFFVLSGFCIHLPQAQRFHRTGTDSLDVKIFLKRRFQRLYPAYIASVALGAVALAAMDMPWNQIGLYAVVNAFFLLAVRPDALMLGPVYWTLWYELQFYFFYPLLLKLCRRVGFASVGGVLLGLEILFAVVPTPEFLKPLAPHFEWFCLRRYFEWFLGMWLAEKIATGENLTRLQAWGLMALGFGGGVMASHIPMAWPLHELALTFGSVGLVSVLLPRSSREVVPVRCGMWIRIFGFAGAFSYSLYLIHMPLLRILNWAVCRLSPDYREDYGEMTFLIAGLVLVPVVAWLWYLAFEKPSIPKPRVEKAEGRRNEPSAFGGISKSSVA